jgi:hypothetical protein
MCGGEGALQIDGQLQTLSRARAKLGYEKKLDCSRECEERLPGMKSACTHLNTNGKSKHYNEAVPCGYRWKGKKLWEDLDGLEEACAVDVRTW